MAENYLDGPMQQIKAAGDQINKKITATATSTADQYASIEQKDKTSFAGYARSAATPLVRYRAQLPSTVFQ